MLTVADLLELFETYIGDSGSGRRKATQDDIDRMYK